MKVTIRKVSVIFCLWLILYGVGAVLFVGVEGHHHCLGQQCPICHQIHVVRIILDTLLKGMLGGVLLLLLEQQVILMIDALILLLNKHTLISLKVELLN